MRIGAYVLRNKYKRELCGKRSAFAAVTRSQPLFHLFQMCAEGYQFSLESIRQKGAVATAAPVHIFFSSYTL